MIENLHFSRFSKQHTEIEIDPIFVTFDKFLSCFWKFRFSNENLDNLHFFGKNEETNDKTDLIS